MPNNTVKQYGQYEVFEGTNGFGSKVYRVGMYQTPAYFMQRLAYLASRQSMGAKISTLFDSELAKKYEGVRTEFVYTANVGIVHPHWTETYYLIAKNNFEKIK